MACIHSCKFHIDIADSCDKYQCSYHGICRTLSDGTAECICPICKPDEVYSPVCGFDGKTYSSICQMRRKSCKDQKYIRVAKEEACGKHILDFIVIA